MFVLHSIYKIPPPLPPPRPPPPPPSEGQQVGGRKSADGCRRTFSLSPNSSESKKELGLLSIYKFSLVQPFELGGETRLIRSDVKK
jgi:hypothetical protein